MQPLDKLGRREYSLRTAYHAGPPRFRRTKRLYWMGKRPRTWAQLFQMKKGK